MENKDRLKLTYIVIPAYKAEKTIAWVFSRIPRSLEGKNVRVLVIDDGSPDGTSKAVEEAKASFFLPVHVIRKPQNEGYARAQKTGFRYALENGAEIVALLHADGQYAPEKLPELLAPLENDEADIVMGSRMLAGGALKGGMPFYKYVANKTLTAIENLVYGLRVSEYHSGYMLYSKRFLESFPFERLSDTFHFDGEMIMMSGKKKMRFKEIAIPTHYGEEKSHLKPIPYGINVLKIMWRYKTGKYDF